MLSFLATGQTYAQKKADLSRLVVIGDSLAAGYLNSSLHEAQQPHGFASLVAAQRNLDLPLPLIAAPGVPNVLTLLSPGPPPIIVPAPGFSTGRVNLFLQPMNLSVPLHNVQDALTTRPDFPVDSLTDLVLGFPGLLGGVSRSQVEWAEGLAPSTVFVWIGNNDALFPMIAGDPAFLTPAPVFEAAFSELMSRLQATGATLVAANIPDVGSIPYLVAAQEVAELTGVPLAVIGPLLGIGAEDFVTLDSLSLTFAVLAGMVPGPLPASAVLTASEMNSIRSAVDVYNGIISAQARASGAVVVDIHALTSEIRKKGYVVEGRRLTTRFLGGIFSLDGIHPTYTGHAIIANAFIHELNTHLAAGIPYVSVEQVAKTDPLRPRVP
ncbi:MAG: hypothetical protein IT167_28500 [Bryobacterales bacterium]|nr:hypothetical protein [Bryobacterales bacterium]